MTAQATRWTCARCAVSVGRIDGEPVNQPANWTKGEDQSFCLACSRAMAGDAALDVVAPGTSSEERSRIRRRALIEFEIGRDPAAPNRTIAQVCRTSSAAVAAVRKSHRPEEPLPWR